jgi:hypothetical protein
MQINKKLITKRNDNQLYTLIATSHIETQTRLIIRKVKKAGVEPVPPNVTGWCSTIKLLLRVTGNRGIEPLTVHLTGVCSTIELITLNAIISRVGSFLFKVFSRLALDFCNIQNNTKNTHYL